MKKLLANKTVLRLLCAALAAVAAFTALPVGSSGETAPDAEMIAPTPEESLRPYIPGLYYAADELMVDFEEGVSDAAERTVARKYGADIVGKLAETDVCQFRFASYRSVGELETLAAEIASEPGVSAARLNKFQRETPQPEMKTAEYKINEGREWRADLVNDTDMQGKSWAAEALNAPAAWRYFDSVRDYIYPVKVGVTDTGFAPWHEDLDFLELYNFPTDRFVGDFGHGTSTAGCMAATGNNNAGIVGIYPYGYKNLLGFAHNYYGQQHNSPNIYGLCAGLAWLIEKGAKVINFSVADYIMTQLYYFSYVDDNSEMRGYYYREMRENETIVGDCLQGYLDDGYDFVIVAAAGNYSNSDYFQAATADGRIVTLNMKNYQDAFFTSCCTYLTREKYPEVFDRIIVVGAIDRNNRCTDFTCIGDRVDLYAPGDGVYTLGAGESFNDWGYITSGGTSLSAPLIAGVAADVLTMNPWLRGDEVKRIVKFIAGPYKNSSGFPYNPDTLQAVYLAGQVRDELAIGKPNTYGITFAPRHGDVDRDGKVSVTDARLALRTAIGLQRYKTTSIPFRHADMDKSGDVSVVDARTILRMAIGIERVPITY